ncbi:MAG: hypothetical protein ACHBN1_34940 [Heteroscytonema crispum UTEX LB 1556]
MKKPLLVLTRLAVTVAGISFASLLAPQPSFADFGQVNDPQNLDPQNSTDPFRQGVEQNPFSLFQLIHNANFGGLNPDFASEQKQELNDAAAAFKARQQKLLQGQQQANPGSQVIITPQSGN